MKPFTAGITNLFLKPRITLKVDLHNETLILADTCHACTPYVYDVGDVSNLHTCADTCSAKAGRYRLGRHWPYLHYTN